MIPEGKIIPEPNSGCLLWIGAVTPSGYGKLWLGSRCEYVHRIAWMDSNGPIPEGMQVCHKCDVPSCVNPDHLFLGSRADNANDAVSKGRWNPPRKLTEAQVQLIRTLVENGATQRSVATMFETGYKNVSKIVLRQRWKSL